MKIAGLNVWGDSIAKGVVFDEERGRYAVCRDNCLMKLSRETGVTVSNHSVMGQTSENGLDRMHAESLHPGEVAVIEYGGNDCDLDWKAVSEHPEIRQDGKVPLEQFGRNLSELIKRVRNAGVLPVLVTPAPLIAKRYFEWICRGLNRENILKYLGDVEAIFRWQEAYADCVRRVASEMKVYLVDIRSCMLETGRLDELMCIDGIHPNAAGHDVIFRSVVPLLV